MVDASELPRIAWRWISPENWLSYVIVATEECSKELGVTWSEELILAEFTNAGLTSGYHGLPSFS